MRSAQKLAVENKLDATHGSGATITVVCFEVLVELPLAFQSDNGNDKNASCSSGNNISARSGADTNEADDCKAFGVPHFYGG